MIKLRSIRQKLVAVVLMATLAAMLVSVGALIAYDLRGYHRALVGDVTTHAEPPGRMPSAAPPFADPPGRHNIAACGVIPIALTLAGQRKLPRDDVRQISAI